MSQNDRFASGFMFGALLGGIIGGAVGALAASRIKPDSPGDAAFPDDATEASMEAARQGLEVKIAQLNDAIDSVRQQLGEANGHDQPSWQSRSGVDG